MKVTKGSHTDKTQTFFFCCYRMKNVDRDQEGKHLVQSRSRLYKRQKLKAVFGCEWWQCPGHLVTTIPVNSASFMHDHALCFHENQVPESQDGLGQIFHLISYLEASAN